MAARRKKADPAPEPVETVTTTTTTAERSTVSDDINNILEFDEDISGVEAPEPIPAGRTYPAQIMKAERLESNRTGNQYIAVHFKISPDDYPADYDLTNAPDGTTLVFRRIPYGQSRAEKFRVKQFAQTIGAPLGASLDLNDWIGRDALVAVEHEEYEEQLRAQIVRVLPA